MNRKQHAFSINFTRVISGLKGNTFRSLRHRNYRLFFYGQSLSLVGTWVQRIATPWLVYRLTDSALMLGVIGFASQISNFLISPFAGVVIDRVDRFKVLLITQILSLVQASLLAALYLTDVIQVWHVIVLNLFLGAVNAFDAPARQAFVIDMVEGKQDLPNAIALNSAMFNGARLIGPTVAGILIAATGEGVCFLLNAVSYVFVIASLLRMKVRRKEFNIKKSNVMQNLREGFSYTFRSIPIRSILLLLAIASFTAMQYVVLIPVFSKEVLHGTSRTFGFLMAISGLGALTGTLFLASKNSVKGLEKVIPWAAMVFGLSLVLFSFSRHAFVAFPLILVVGASMMLQTASSNTLIQTIVDEDKRGRIMSIYTMSFMGTAPFGALLTGWLAKVLNVSLTLMICGTIMFVAASVFLYYLPAIKKALFKMSSTEWK